MVAMFGKPSVIAFVIGVVSGTTGNVWPVVGVDVTEIDGIEIVGLFGHSLLGSLSLAALGIT